MRKQRLPRHIVIARSKGDGAAIAESDEAIQFSFAALDCFATANRRADLPSLAMTIGGLLKKK